MGVWRERIANDWGARARQLKSCKMEVPTGSWQAANNKKQRARAAWLLLLILCLGELASRAPCSCDHQQTNQAQVGSRQTGDEDLDNSIGGRDVAEQVAAGGGPAAAATARTSQEARKELASEANRRIERRLDKLEFELRKSVHQMRAANLLAEGRAPEARQQPADESPAEPTWSGLASRLELMEKFVASAAAKLFETEQRVRQLEKCDCKLSCKWPTNHQNQTTRKADGQVWRNKCDVCSCHRGSVRCRHVTCPELKCSQAHHVPGKCCPVCYKPCVYKSQTVKHGNKLVINSNKDSCKECMCMDGRLKCQRVELEKFAGRRLQRSTSIELGAPETDQSDESSPEWARLRRHLAQEALVCPEVECAPEEQIRLKNDCCAYCRKFDFCNHPTARHSCHPSAVCINTQMFEQTRRPTNLSELEPAGSATDATIETMFRCSCRRGFRGDGRHCEDIDECADKQLNECDSKTTNCVNLPGGYECRCKRGFRPLAWRPPEISNQIQLQIQIPTPAEQMNGPLPVGGQQLAAAAAGGQRECADIDECAAGNENRCHAEARCVNKRGGYKCACRPGFLGNGLECHKWFSSEPSVAAYLYRHPAARNASGEPPLTSLDDEERKSSRARPNSPPEEDAEDLEEDDDEDDEEERDEDAPDELGPELSQSRWEPLRFEWALQQADQQEEEANQSRADPIETGSGGQEAQTSEQQQLQSLSINTRTMFFQPPPEAATGLWQENVTPQNGRPKAEPAFNNQASPNEAQTTLQVDRPAGESDKSDITPSNTTNDNTDQGKQSESANDQAAPTPPPPPSNGNGNGNGSANANNNSPAGYKRGVIIASATTTPIKNGKAYSSQFYRTRSANGAASSAPSATSFIRIVLYLITFALISSVNQFILFRQQQQEYFSSL